MCRNDVRVGSIPIKNRRGFGVRLRPRTSRQIRVDRGTYERMYEGQLRLIPQDLDPHQGLDQLDRLPVADPGESGSMPELTAAAENRDCSSERPCARPQRSESAENRPLHPLRPNRRHVGSRLSCRAQLSLDQSCGELADKERIATCGRVRRRGEFRMRYLRERGLEQRADAEHAQAGRMQHLSPSLEAQLVKEARVAAGLTPTSGNNDGERQLS
jgi:hypothetical protein